MLEAWEGGRLEAQGEMRYGVPECEEMLLGWDGILAVHNGQGIVSVFVVLRFLEDTSRGTHSHHSD